MELTIEQIAEAIKGRLVWKGNPKDRRRTVSCVTLDSRQIAENGVFVATVGQRVDGHKFVSHLHKFFHRAFGLCFQ